jgi:hypothetical protein
MRARRKITNALAGLALLFAASLTAGEKVQFRGSTSIALPKPTRSLEDARSTRLPEGRGGQDETDAALGISAPVATTPQMDKKLKEFLDKKKNWIFVNPYENQYDAKTEEFMEGEKSTGLYEHRLLKEEDKGVMEKFLQERSPYREDEGDPEKRAKDPEHGPTGEAQRQKEQANERVNERPQPVANTLNVQQPADRASGFSVDQKSPSLFGNTSLFDQKPERSAIGDRPLMFNDRPERMMSKEDIRKERDTRDAEITRMLQPRGGPGGLSSRLDPMNSGGDRARPDAGGPRTESFLNATRTPTAAGGIGSGNSVIFSGGGRPSSLPPRSGFDLGPKASSAANASVGVRSLPSPAAASRPAANQPFVLPLPQRKF